MKSPSRVRSTRRRPPKRRRLAKKLLLLLLIPALIPPLEIMLVKHWNPGATTVMWQRSIQHPDWPREQHWIPLDKIPQTLIWFTLLSEDSRFFEHNGIDWIELNHAIEQSKTTGRSPRGASTITMQTARSVFLWQGRSYFRKVLELYYSFWMETILSKERILELYLNLLETGPGVYGMEAGARYQFDLPLHKLNRAQLALLVAILPNPIEKAARFPTRSVLNKQEWILKYSTRWQKPDALEN